MDGLVVCLALQIKENGRVRASFFSSLAWRHKPRQSGLLSGQWLSTPRSDRECEWDETEGGWKTRRADETQGLARVIGWVWLFGEGYTISLYCIRQRGDLQKMPIIAERQIRLKPRKTFLKIC